MIPDSTVIATVLIVLAFLPKGRQNYPGGAVYAEKCHQAGELIGIGFTKPLYVGDQKILRSECNKFDPPMTYTSSYLLLPDIGAECFFYSSSDCTGPDMDWNHATKDDQAKSAYCSRGNCGPPYIGAVYADPWFRGKSQNLQIYCTTFHDLGVSSYIILPIANCNFFREKRCLGDKVEKFDSGGEKEPWWMGDDKDDKAQSAYCTAVTKNWQFGH